jgi:hypothetical protein
VNAQGYDSSCSKFAECVLQIELPQPSANSAVSTSSNSNLFLSVCLRGESHEEPTHVALRLMSACEIDRFENA